MPVGLKIQAIEEMELLYPLLVEQMEIETDSMGFGERNGGPGVRLVARPTRGDMECITFGDGYNNPPHGVLGGTAAIGGGMYIEAPDGGRRFLSSTAHVAVSADEKMVGVGSGGGGYGNRSIVTSSWCALRCGTDSSAAMLPETSTAWSSVTMSIPRSMWARRMRCAPSTLGRERPMVTPTVPNSSTWLAEHITDADEYLVNAKLALSEMS